MDRFWQKIDKSGEHWLWMGAKAKGYGQIRVGRKLRYAHRFAWELANGPIPPGKFVLHRCDVRACVRLACLFLGTHADNMADMIAKGRQARGSKHGAAKRAATKLDEADIPFIRHWLECGYSQVKIAEAFGVTDGLISRIKTGRLWAYAGDPHG